MSGFQGYDQWKTASPDDDHDDEHCAYCGADLQDDVTDYTDIVENAIMDGYCNPECQAEGDKGNISPRYGLPPAPNGDQQKQIRALWDHLSEWRANCRPAPSTFADIGELLPEGDFRWDDDDPGDAHVYCCGERDCPVQWHEAYYNTTIERKDGKLIIEIHDGDRDGNWDINTSWEEGEDWEGSGISYFYGEGALRQYFVGWLEYWIDAAETGKDPCNQLMMRSHLDKDFNWVDACLKAAQSNADALPLPKPWWIRLLNRIKRLF